MQSWNTIEKAAEDFHKSETGYEFNQAAACTPLTGSGKVLDMESMASLVLHPAPGEEFDLEVNVADEVMNVATVSITVQVGCFEWVCMAGMGLLAGWEEN